MSLRTQVRTGWTTVVVVAGVFVAGQAPSAQAGEAVPLQYPQAPRDGTVDTYFGVKVPAPYQWMENLENPQLAPWIEAENRLTEAYMEKIPVRKRIKERLTTLWNYERESTPQQVKGGRIFFGRNTGLQNQSVLFVQDSPAGTARELLDPNRLSPDGSVALLGVEPSPRGTLLAYNLSQGGSDWLTVHVRDVATGNDLPDVIRWVKFSGVSWTEDEKGFFYSRYPEPPPGKAISQQVINQKLYYHQLGTDQSADKLVYARPDMPEWLVQGSVTEDGRYLFVYLENGTAPQNELYYLDLGNPLEPTVAGTPKPLYTRNDAKYQVAGNDGPRLFIYTTLDAPRGRVVAASLESPEPGQWQALVPQTEAVIQSAQMAGGRVLVDYQDVAKSRVSLFATNGQALGDLKLPTMGSVSGISARNDSQTVYYGFTSFLVPESVYRHNLESGAREVFFQPQTRFDAAPYELSQQFYTSKDGTRVPMFLLAKKGLKRDGNNPTILYGYGGFDITITPRYNPVLPVWLELGGVYAVANLRGGGTYGEKWHEAGMLGHKQNVFDDFAWGAKYLIAQKITQPRRLGIQGYSNGGLLVGASITEHPELFGSAYAGAGVLDMLRYQRFSGGALWAPEYGTSDNEKAFRWLYAFSPLANVKRGTCYPPTLITTADHDDRVVPSHSYQFAAALQQAQGCANPILLRVETKTSHGYMPTDKRIAQTADVWAFQAYTLGMRP
ncbi:MAG TPA: prolyl oligopeptidase family serine peptidase [Verrucomicrobiae bacterium]|nr:prolyl oligopeptidase family serine peptidase [Verrucomicrobiae bacterium]